VLTQHSWPSITDTTAISDDELTERLRSTNLYAALLSAATNGGAFALRDARRPHMLMLVLCRQHV
jgi:hypothetical protein